MFIVRQRGEQSSTRHLEISTSVASRLMACQVSRLVYYRSFISSSRKLLPLLQEPMSRSALDTCECADHFLSDRRQYQRSNVAREIRDPRRMHLKISRRTMLECYQKKVTHNTHRLFLNIGTSDANCHSYLSRASRCR